MPNFVSKKKKYNLSRIPYGDLTVEPYIIRPYTYSLQKMLDEQLDELLNSEPKCIDSQNGNVLDNIIESWKKRAKNGIDNQRAYHLEIIRTLDFNRKSNLRNAEDWLDIDIKELDKLKNELDELEQEAKKFNKNMPEW